MSGLSTYRPGNIKDSELRNELSKIVHAANAADPSFLFKSTGDEPPRPVGGMLALADGDSWNPGFGPGLYRRNQANTLWLPVGNDIVWAEWFGAVGDGVTDDTTAIQAAIDYLYGIGGGELRFRPKKYVVSTTLDVPQRVWLVGQIGGFVNQFVSVSAAPKGTVIFLASGSNVDVVRFRCRLEVNGGVLVETTLGTRNSEARHCGGARNLTVWGNRSTNQLPTVADLNTAGSCVFIQGARYVVLERVFAMFGAENGVEMGSFNYGLGALSSNNAEFYRVSGHSNVDYGMNLAGGDNTIIIPNCGYNGLSGIQNVGTATITGGACWNNFAHGFTSSVGTVRGVIPITGMTCYDNNMNGFRLGGSAYGYNLSGCTARGNGRDAGATAADRANYLVGAGVAAWSLTSCHSQATDQDGNITAQYDFHIDNSTYFGSIDGITWDKAAPAALGNSISTPANLIAHGEKQLIAHPGVTFTGTVDFDSNVLNKMAQWRGAVWASVTIAAGAITPGNNSLVSLNEAAPVNLTDITFGSTGLPEITIRNIGTNAVTFVHNTAKLRLNSGANIVLNQHQTIQFRFVSGTVWQHVGGKQT